jgi:hypothetical protein
MTELDWVAFLVLISVFLVGAGIACVRPAASGIAVPPRTPRRRGLHRPTRSRLAHSSGPTRAVRQLPQTGHRRLSAS